MAQPKTTTTRNNRLHKTGRKPMQRAKGAKSKPKRSLIAPLAGILVMVVIFGLLNNQLIAAQFIQRTRADLRFQTQSAPVITKIDANAPSELAIPVLGVTAPIIDEPSIRESDIQNSLQKGVVHYANTAYPGQKGNVVIFGHSSGAIWTAGDYKFVFTRLGALKTDDFITVNYKGVHYTYKVTDSTVIPPTDFSVVQPTSTPQLTLITCTPVGTNKNRLVVRARQISPDPNTAQAGIGATTHTVTAGTLPK